MNLHFFYALFLCVMMLSLTGCGDDGNDSSSVVDSVVSSITLSEEQIDVEERMDSASFKGGQSLDLVAGVGSGAFHSPNDPNDEFYTVTDRGPSIDCGDSKALLGMDDFCLDNGVVDEDGKIFAMPNFTPTIYKFNIDTGGAIGAKVGYQIMQAIKLMDRDDNLITGLPNPLQGMTTENGYDTNGNKLTFDPEGIDPEAIIKLSNGTFWLAEEYAPSLVHVTANGRILERIVPTSVETDLADANYRVLGGLPTILKKRRINRGIESLALSSDEQFLYFMTESPLANPDNEAYENSRYVRLFKISLLQGDFNSVVGEYVYTIDEPETFLADNTNQQSDVKVSDMLALETDRLIIVERVLRHTKLYRVSLDDATNILDTEWDIEATTSSAKALEKLDNLADWGIIPLGKNLVFDSRREISDLPSQIEGIALLNSQYLVFINDNDFGIDGAKTRIRVTQIGGQLNQ